MHGIENRRLAGKSEQMQEVFGRDKEEIPPHLWHGNTCPQSDFDLWPTDFITYWARGGGNRNPRT